ncbi:MAG: bifunctional riboflavin kinase/FAD synthetase [Actinomycetia bacterium]|nr:bifunctional riboflavin kinase/FAD synthetase [Actinomycetes bacterium]
MARTLVVIGNFDGVHVGHRALLREALAAGSQAVGDPRLVVVTFWPHPLRIVAPRHAPRLLDDLTTRIELLKAAGAHEVRVVPFSPHVADWTPETFVASVIAPLDPTVVMVGENFRFGRRAEGTPDTLRTLGAGRFDVCPLPLVRYGDAAVCSTAIRSALADGDLAGANAMLGRPFRLRGVVQMGDQRGRALGFPTANLPVTPEFAVPADGVYAGWLTRIDEQGRRLPAAINVGSNPTFDGCDSRVEAYVLDHDDLELYGVEVAVDFASRLRGMVRFDGVDALVAQVRRDVADTRAALQNTPS